MNKKGIDMRYREIEKLIGSREKIVSNKEDRNRQLGKRRKCLLNKEKANVTF